MDKVLLFMGSIAAFSFFIKVLSERYTSFRF